MPPATDSAASRRSQPMRQTRTNPSRASGVSRSGPGREVNSGPAPDQPIDIYPAITHFTDAITALPKELVRHFTLMKEVDAKIWAPEEQLHHLIEACSKAPFPQPQPQTQAAGTSDSNAAALVATTTGSASQSVVNGVTLDHNVQPLPATDDAYKMAVHSNMNISRRQLFHSTAQHVKEMIMSLEEKNHVISTANEALERLSYRMENAWPALQQEFSDEAKYGSTIHWAYPENRTGKPAHNERGRRDGLPHISAAAQQLADEAAARSESRKQAVQAKKNAKNQQNHQESDFDDHDRHKGDGKKSQGGSKVRKTAPETSASVGLGITPGTTANGNPPAKRRKVEKPSNGAAAPERAMASALSGSAAKTKPTSPRETPAPDTQKKRKALPSGPTQAKKSRNGVGTSSATSSPVLGAFPENKAPARNSPGPAAAPPRPATARAKQSSSQGPAENGKARPSSSASNKTNGAVTSTPDAAPPTISWPRSAGEAKPKPPKEPSGLSKVENCSTVNAPTKEPEPPQPAEVPAPPSVPTASKKELIKPAEVVPEKPETPEKPEKKSETAPPVVQPTVMTTVTTKSGRASKPSTPALATFQEAARSRASRALDAPTATKRSHKKGAGLAAMAAAAREAADDDPNNSSLQGEDEDGDPDADEPLYCYCNSVSYGSMVACDADGCEREWFHLDCAGLKVAPKTNVKWYCEDCKERLKVGVKKVNGR